MGFGPVQRREVSSHIMVGRQVDASWSGRICTWPVLTTETRRIGSLTFICVSFRYGCRQIPGVRSRPRALSFGAGWRGDFSCGCVRLRAVLLADAVPGVEAAQRHGRPPVRVADEAHGGGHKQYPHEGDVEDQGDDARELLMMGVLPYATSAWLRARRRRGLEQPEGILISSTHADKRAPLPVTDATPNLPEGQAPQRGSGSRSALAQLSWPYSAVSWRQALRTRENQAPDRSTS